MMLSKRLRQLERLVEAVGLSEARTKRVNEARLEYDDTAGGW